MRLFVDEDRIRVTVEDRGAGLPPESADRTEGIGLSVIRALADEVRFVEGSEGGTRVEMDFAAQRAGRPLLQAPTAAGPDDRAGRCQDEDEVVVSLSPVGLLTGVLGRLARTLAATAHFSLDRFSDVYLVTDTLAAHAARGRGRARGSTLGWRRPSAASSSLWARFDRARARSCARLATTLRRPRWCCSATRSRCNRDGDGELLHVVVIDHRR